MHVGMSAVITFKFQNTPSVLARAGKKYFFAPYKTVLTQNRSTGYNIFLPPKGQCPRNRCPDTFIYFQTSSESSKSRMVERMSW